MGYTEVPLATPAYKKLIDNLAVLPFGETAFLFEPYIYKRYYLL